MANGRRTQREFVTIAPLVRGRRRLRSSSYVVNIFLQK
jgi:hypothetical protein